MNAFHRGVWGACGLLGTVTDLVTVINSKYGEIKTDLLMPNFIYHELRTQ